MRTFFTWALMYVVFISNAFAETTNQNLLTLLSGGTFYPNASIDANFAKRQYYGTNPSQFTVSRASSESEVCNGQIYTFGTNAPPITPCGLWAWESRTNSIPNNTNQGAGAGAYPTGWSVYNPSGATVTVLGTTVNNGISYLVVSLSGTTTASSQIQIFQTGATGIAATAGQVWTQSIYAYYSGSLTGISSVGAQANWNTSGGAYVSGPFGTSFTPTTSPAQYQGSTLISGGTVAFLQPIFIINVTTGQTLSGTLYFALAQMELNPNATIAAQGFATGPILTSSGAVTRNANQLSATIPSCANPSLLAIGTPYAPVTYPTQQMAAEADDGASHYMQVSRAATTGLANFGISGTTQTIAGAWAQSASGKIAESIGGGNMSGRFNGGSPQTTAATLSQASTKLQIGSQGGSLNFNGVLSRVAVACNGASLLNR